jgi:hypothetical protein
MKRRIGIFGETECGKTTLAKSLARGFYDLWKIPSLVLDPWCDDPEEEPWGRHAKATSNVVKFKKWVAKREGCLVIVDDTSATIQRDKEFIPFFTCIRHQHHHLMVMGHDGTDLLPVMRRSINELYLFQQTVDSVKQWRASQPSMLGIEVSATPLEEYEFVFCRKRSTAVRRKLKR